MTYELDHEGTYDNNCSKILIDDKPSNLELLVVGTAVAALTTVCIETGVCKHPDNALLLSGSLGAMAGWFDSHVIRKNYLREFTVDTAICTLTAVDAYLLWETVGKDTLGYVLNLF